MTTTRQQGKHKTTVEIDLELLAHVQEVLGTKGIKETIDKALDDVWRRHLRERFLRQLETQDGIDIGPEMLEETRAHWKKWVE